MFETFALLATLAAAQPIEIPFELDPHYRGIFIHVLVNGKDAVVLVDTGASNTWLDADAAGVHRVTLARSRFRPDVGFDVTGVRKPAVLHIGPTRASERFRVADLDALSSRYGRPVDGVLGQDILGRFTRVTIDYRTKRLVME
jgi:hypothetical protein